MQIAQTLIYIWETDTVGSVIAQLVIFYKQ